MANNPWDPIGWIGNAIGGAVKNGIAGAQIVGGDLKGGLNTLGYGSKPVAKKPAAKPAAKKPAAGPAGNPWDDLYAWADQFGQESGGSGGGGSGGGGGGGAYAALMAQIQAQKDNANARYADQKGQINQIYTQYANSLKPNEAATKAGYQTAINNANTAGGQIAQQANAHAAANDQQRNAALASLGVTGAATSGQGQEAQALNKGNMDLAQQNSSWGNLEGVLSNAQQARDRLDVQGATDAGVLATQQLTNSYEQYMRQLDQQAAGAAASASGGGGSSGGGGGGKAATYKNPMLDMINKAIGNDMIDQVLGRGNYKPSNKPTYTAAQISSAYKKVNAVYAKNPSISTAQIKAKVGPSVWNAYNSN